MASAGKGVSQVMNRCEMAKATGYLDLSDCGLLYVADAIYLVLKEYQISKCNLKNNGLKNFPKRMIEKLPHVMQYIEAVFSFIHYSERIAKLERFSFEKPVLNLENNKLTDIPDELGRWSQMRALNLSHNKLTSFPEVLFKLEMLQFLDIGNNEIEDLDFERVRTSMPALKQLSVQGNPLAEKESTRAAAQSLAAQDLVIRIV